MTDLKLQTVDKTPFIKELLQNWGEVNLFTRPRRFGKSLNMSMLKSFFEIGIRPELFDGLEIMKEKELCEKYMGKFPVISISLKSVDGLDFKAASAALRTVIGNEAGRFRFLRESTLLDGEDKIAYDRLIQVKMESDASSSMSDAVLADSLKTLSFLLSKHSGQKVILLIDDYDVPMDKAFQAGYYDEMVSLIRNLFGNVLKTNPKGDAATIQDMLHDYLWDSISVRDTAVRRNMKENFYHGMLLGLLQSQDSWLVRSNAETGEEYSDISIRTSDRVGIIIEIKYADDGNLEAACSEALRQIEEKKYAEGLNRRGTKQIIKYGIAFCEKECMVVMA